MLNFMSVYFCYHIKLKYFFKKTKLLNQVKIHDPDCSFDRLIRDAQVNLMYRHLNIKKNIILNKI